MIGLDFIYSLCVRCFKGEFDLKKTRQYMTGLDFDCLFVQCVLDEKRSWREQGSKQQS